MADIFISYTKLDEVPARGLLRHLRLSRIETFLSSEALLIGDNWFNQLTQELKKAKIVVLMLSPKSVHKPWVNFEAGWAWSSKRKLIIPARFGGLKLSKVPQPYSALQGVDLHNESDKLMQMCYRRLGMTAEPHKYTYLQNARFQAALKGDWLKYSPKPEDMLR